MHSKIITLLVIKIFVVKQGGYTHLVATRKATYVIHTLSCMHHYSDMIYDHVSLIASYMFCVAIATTT